MCRSTIATGYRTHNIEVELGKAGMGYGSAQIHSMIVGTIVKTFALLVSL
jgi:hypothetical protein